MNTKHSRRRSGRQKRWLRPRSQEYGPRNRRTSSVGSLKKGLPGQPFLFMGLVVMVLGRGRGWDWGWWLFLFGSGLCVGPKLLVPAGDELNSVGCNPTKFVQNE